MAEQGHRYETRIEWRHDRQGMVSAAPRPVIVTGAPAEFGGTDEVWSPEHLCVAAVNACIMLTFIAIAANSKVAFRKYTATAVGTLEKVERRGAVITRVVVQPRITIGPEGDRVRVERVIGMAEKHCYISNSLNAEVVLEPEIVSE